MLASIRAVGVVVVALIGVTTAITAAQQAASPTPQASASPFAGRWEIVVKPPAGGPGPSEIPFAIVEISVNGTDASAKLIDGMGAPMITMTLASVAVKADVLELALEMMGDKVVFTGKRVGDHLEGKATARSDDPADWTGRITTKDKVPALAEMAAAMQAAQTANVAPDQLAYTVAIGKANPLDRETALTKFLSDFPTSTYKDAATLQLALTKPGPEKTAALRAFIENNPESKQRDQAEYELTRTMVAGPDRLAAEERFIAKYPNSQYRSAIVRAWFDTAVGQKPVSEARLTAAIDGMLATSPDRSIRSGQYTVSTRAQTLNSIADRLMANEVMLDRALELIQEAIKLDGDKPDPSTLTIHMTTYGQVLFKMKRYDEAGDALKKAIVISGGDGDGETQLFLGKYYEVKSDEDKALDAYLKANDLGSPLDTRASLERLYVKRYGSLATLDKALDDKYRAKGKGFEPGHFTRPATTGPAHVVLAELFTGAECAPCVSADLAFDGMTERYDRATVATLIYHLHIPGPDPMTNPDTLARAKYYGTNSTPTAFVDGQSKQSGGGDRSFAQRAFTGYTSLIEKRLSTTPLASLDGLKARITGNAVEVVGEAKLLPAGADRAGHVSLHVALAENDVRYVGSNGIRFHNLVVRKLVGSAQGAILQGPNLSATVTETVDLASVTNSLNGYLDTYEKGRGSFKFKERVAGIDAAKLVVVAFVQDDETKEILQAVVITPVR